MSGEEIRTNVVEHIQKWAGEAVVTEDKSRLKEDCGLDWLDMEELEIDIEEQFGIFIDTEKIKTVGELVKAVQAAVERRGDESPRTGQETISGNDAGE